MNPMHLIEISRSDCNSVQEGQSYKFSLLVWQLPAWKRALGITFETRLSRLLYCVAVQIGLVENNFLKNRSHNEISIVLYKTDILQKTNSGCPLSPYLFDTHEIYVI